MTTKRYNHTNFHKHTFCIFNEVHSDAIRELNPNYKSKSGSWYYFTEEGVFRLSNHWSRVANCRWRLQTNPQLHHSENTRTRLGFAKWADFYSDNEHEKLYFITVDFDQQTANYFHKQSSNYQSEFVLRTASETVKMIKQIRILLQESAWTNHLKEMDIAVLRQRIITELIISNCTFQEIRRHYLP
ncbi:MAG: hypothetical protein JNJ52_08530 [Flavobacterium sp.]|nr:hypothetical protein [Flavobacterium sp.]